MKKFVTWVLIIFLVFWLFTRPESFANSIGGIWDFFIQLFRSAVRFFNSL
jgi:hypothetical protein